METLPLQEETRYWEKKKGAELSLLLRNCTRPGGKGPLLPPREKKEGSTVNIRWRINLLKKIIQKLMGEEL